MTRQARQFLTRPLTQFKFQRRCHGTRFVAGPRIFGRCQALKGLPSRCQVSGEDHPWVYFVLLNPDERQEFQRQVTLSSRQHLSRAMRGMREYE
jgi:hypothetical protein